MPYLKIPKDKNLNLPFWCHLKFVWLGWNSASSTSSRGWHKGGQSLRSYHWTCGTLKTKVNERNDCRNQINIQKDQHKITNKLFEVQTKTEFSTAENHLNRMKSNTNLLVKNIKLNSSTEVYLLLNKEKYFRLNRSRK